MRHDYYVRGAVLSKDESRILSWSDDKTLRLWDNRWPHGNLLEFTCSLLLPDYGLAEVCVVTVPKPSAAYRGSEVASRYPPGEGRAVPIRQTRADFVCLLRRFARVPFC
jgi:hypothetical protein